MTSNKLFTFIAVWNKDFGAEIKDRFPKDMEIDLEFITMQIFIAFENFYLESDEKSIERTFIKIPFKNLNRNARILLDTFDNESSDKIQPFIVVFLFPDYFPDSALEKFNDILFNISSEFKTDRKSLLNTYFDEITQLFALEQTIHDKNLKIDENYTFQDGLVDFKSGIELLKRKEFESAYYLLVKSYQKFNEEKNLKFSLESCFYIATILSHLKKYNSARDYYRILEESAQQLNHQKYYETAIFMTGFCSYCLEDYSDALKRFMELETKTLQYINKFQFHFIYGRIQRLSNLNATAIITLKKALEIGKQLEIKDDTKENLAKLYLELGHTNYNLAIDMVKSGEINAKIFDSYLQNSINYYKDSIEIWEELEKYSILIEVYRLIGSVYEVSNDLNAAIENYSKALKYAEEINDVISRLQIFNQIIDNLDDLGLYERMVKEIDSMISKVKSYAFLDLLTISRYHKKLGEALFRLGHKKEALSELLISLNIYNKFDTPLEESIAILTKIIEIYGESADNKYIEYYEENLNTLIIKLDEEQNKKGIIKVLECIKEIWILKNEGIELFSYAPESKVNPQLFGGFISAIQSFSMELASDFLKSMNIGYDQYTLYREENQPFFMIGRSTSKLPLSVLQKGLKTAQDEFIKLFGNDFEDFEGDTSKFQGFLDNLKDLVVVE